MSTLSRFRRPKRWWARRVAPLVALGPLGVTLPFGCQSGQPASQPAGTERVDAGDPVTDEPGAAMATEDVERLRLKPRRAESTRPPEIDRRPAYDQPRVRP